MATNLTYSKLYANRGVAWRTDQLMNYSHYSDALTTAKGETGGNSRISGDASQAVQRKVIDALISESVKAGLTQRETAYVLAVARHESGFNPDAASNESATGIGQLIDSTWTGLGMSNSDRWNYEKPRAKGSVSN